MTDFFEMIGQLIYPRIIVGGTYIHRDKVPIESSMAFHVKVKRVTDDEIVFDHMLHDTMFVDEQLSAREFVFCYKQSQHQINT